MKKYKILVFEIEEKTVEVTDYEKLFDSEALDHQPPGTKQYDYVTTGKKSTIETKIFEQITENQIDLVAVITAVNKEREVSK